MNKIFLFSLSLTAALFTACGGDGVSSANPPDSSDSYADEISSANNISSSDCGELPSVQNGFVSSSSDAANLGNSAAANSGNSSGENQNVSSSSNCPVSISSSSVFFNSSSSSAVFEATPNGIPYLKIFTDNSAAIETEYVTCRIELNGNSQYENYVSSGVKIRQRGNSTRIYYDKKPYRIKLSEKSEILGLGANKDWVLLANYRDPTNMMNAVVFDIAREMGNFAFVNSNRFVDVELNGEYIGMYQLTEQIEQASSRVNIESTDVLLSLDVDDGPEESPNEGDNFWSSVYSMPVALKYPKDPSQEKLDSVKADFAILERLIQNQNYDSVKIVLDVPSFIDFILIQEITRNVELAAPRSMYLYKKDSQYHFGPVWDFDGGFGFDWASMTDGHNYFTTQTFLFEDQTYKNAIPGFFSDLFKNTEFAADYKARWQELQSNILTVPFEKLDAYVTETSKAMAKNAERWPIDKTYSTEIQNMKSWLTTRVSNYTGTVSTSSSGQGGWNFGRN